MLTAKDGEFDHAEALDSGADDFLAKPFSYLDLDDVVLAEVERARSHGRVAIDVSRVSGAEVSGRADDLGRVMRNLLDNAMRHARTKVSVSVSTVGSVVELVVADDGPGIPDRD